MYTIEGLVARKFPVHLDQKDQGRIASLLDIPQQNPQFEVISLVAHPLTRVAVNIAEPLTEIPVDQLADPQFLNRYYHRHLGNLNGFRAVVVDSATYVLVLRQIEHHHPGFLRNAFLIDPDGNKGLSGFRWIVTLDDPVRLRDPYDRTLTHAAVLASHNGKDFCQGHRMISSGAADIGILPIIVPE